MECFQSIFHCERVKSTALCDKTSTQDESISCNSYFGSYEPMKQRKVLISGAPDSDRTSLLFEVAFQYAELGQPVIFVSPSKISKLPLLFEKRDQPTVETLSKIQMVYLASKNEFIEFMASVHINYKEPQALLIVDDVDFYFKQSGKYNELAEQAKIFAFLLDAGVFFDKLWESNPDTSSFAGCSIICSTSIADENIDQMPYKSVLNQWFPVQLWVQHDKKQDVFMVRQQNKNNNRDNERTCFSYSIINQRIKIYEEKRGQDS